MTIKINSTEYEIKKLSKKQLLECVNKSKLVYEKLIINNDNNELALALAEYGTLCYYCLYKDNNKAFKSPKNALSCLSISELCTVYDAYNKLSNEFKNSQTECGEKHD